MVIDPIKKALSNQNLAAKLDAIDREFKYMCLAPAGLAIGAVDPASVLQANTVVYLINGVFKTAATQEVAFTATTHDIPPNASTVQECCYYVCIDAAGALTIVMGTIASGLGLAPLPDVPQTAVCVLGMVRISVAAGVTLFDASTDLLSAGHLTVAYTDYGYIAPRFDAAQ